MKTVIFDFDGTLADSLNVIIEVFQDMTGKTKDVPKSELLKLRHSPLPVVAKKIGVPLWKVPFLLWRGRRMMQKRIDEVVIYEGIDEVLRNLHHSGYKLLVVSSNSKHNVRAFLRSNNLAEYFTHVYGGVGLFAKAGALRKVLRRNNLTVDECIYIGDETRDVQACQTIGLRCIAVEWGFANPKFLASQNPYALVKTPTELLSVIQQAEM